MVFSLPSSELKTPRSLHLNTFFLKPEAQGTCYKIEKLKQHFEHTHLSASNNIANACPCKTQNGQAAKLDGVSGTLIHVE